MGGLAAGVLRVSEGTGIGFKALEATWETSGELGRGSVGSWWEFHRTGADGEAVVVGGGALVTAGGL